MKIPAMEQTESISDVLCDVCGDSTRIEGYACAWAGCHTPETIQDELCPA